MGAATVERGIPAFFDRGRQIVTRNDPEVNEAEIKPLDTALRVPLWTTYHGQVADARTGLYEYLLKPNRLDKNTHGDESSPRDMSDVHRSFVPMTPLREKYRAAYLAVLKNGKP